MDDYYDDSADYTPDSRKKRKAAASNFVYVDINTLPPIETVKNEDLKNFTREELLTYLHHQGIEANPSETKPALKQMLRQVISDLEKRKAGIPLDLSSPTHTPRSEDREPKMCADCGSKKANRECLYHRCKGCCNKREFQCTVHRDSLTTGRYDGAPSSPPMATTPLRSNVIFVPPGSVPRTPSLVQGSPVVRAGGLASGPRQVQGSSQHKSSAQATKPTAPVMKDIKFAECPNCKERIPYIGANFFIHLYKCNAELFARIVTSGEIKEVMDIEEDPHQLLRLRALYRFKDNMSFMEELFSSTTVDEIMNSMKKNDHWNEEELQKQIEVLQQQIEEIIQNHKTFQENWQESSSNFVQQLKKAKLNEEEVHVNGKVSANGELNLEENRTFISL